MAESRKLRSLQEMRDNLIANRYTEQQLNESRIADVDGRVVRLADDDALEVIERRIVEEERG